MARNISAEGLRELFAQHSGHALLALLTIEHPDLAEPIRLVNDRQDLSYGGQTYTALPFELTLPADTEETIPQLQVRIDNVGRVLTDLLRSVSDPPAVTVEVVRVWFDGPDADVPSVASELGPMEFSLLDARITATTVTARLGYEIDILNEPATKDIFNPSLAPGLFS